MVKFIGSIISWLRTPWRKSATLSRLFFIGVLVLAGAGSLRPFSHRFLSRGDPRAWSIDFTNIYLGGRLAAEGKNPYCDEEIKGGWQRLCGKEGFVCSVTPGLPEHPLLYPPWALGMLLPLSQLPYRYADALWYFLLAVSLFAIGLFGWLLFGRRLPAVTAMTEIFLLCAAFKPTLIIALSGQPGIIVYAALLACLFYLKTSRPFIGGIFLGIASMKFTLAIPVYVYLLLKREARGLAGAFSVAGVSLLAFSLFSGGPHLGSFLHLAGVFNQLRLPPDFTMSFIPDNRFNIESMSEIGPVLLLIRPQLSHWLPWIYAGTAGILLWIAGRGFVTGRYCDLQSLLLFFGAMMLTMYYQYYDQLPFLILLYPFIRSLSARTTALFYGVNVFQFLPLGGMLHHFPILCSSFPLVFLFQPIIALANIALLFAARQTTPKSFFAADV